MSASTKVLVTGAAGMVGRELLKELAASSAFETVATDIAAPPNLPGGMHFQKLDVTTTDPDKVIGEVRPDVIIHLASIVTPPKGTGRDFAYQVDVEGTRKILEAAVAYNVRRLVVTSSGAAYGYHADNAVPLRESDPIRGNAEFAYSHHKRLVEEMLAEAREVHPALEQVIFRVGTVLGAGTENQITALFHRPKLLAVRGYESPFVFIWTRDLARILMRAAEEGPAGIYNVAGDGALGISDLARILNKSVRAIPAWALKTALAIAKPLGLTQYGPEQVGFLQHRPVLDNSRLKSDFGYQPELSSAEVFDLWRREAGL
ncbi:MAG: SDR family oxidoreductase [Alphaproteobacteria bacterium]|nr:MAG: SDR family oxidoreductase [Alphaproteobacteria bacterium]